MRKSAVMVFLIALMATPTAFAGGYDIPVLYNARHLGMGGAAVADVNDASALFHNPAGLGQMGKGIFGANFTLLVGDLRSKPYQLENPNQFGPSITSQVTVATSPLGGFGFRVHKRLSFGLAAFPVGAATGTYFYDDPSGGAPVQDKTELVFIDMTPGFALNFDEIGLRIGAGWRATFVKLIRQRNTLLGPVDVNMGGWSFDSFRVGMQWRFNKNVAIGASYRHKSITEITQGAGGSALGTDFLSSSTEFILPARLATGIRLDFGKVGIAFDFEYGFNSQNKTLRIEGRSEARPNPGQLGNGCPPTDAMDTSINNADGTFKTCLDNVFNWSDIIVFRTGLEYRFAKDRFPVRIGFIYDGKTANAQFPTGFGTPPTPTYVGTVGFGWDNGPFEMNFAYAFRYGKKTVSVEDTIQPGGESLFNVCPACGGPGDYRFRLHSMHLDFSYDWQ